ncbi:chondroitinase-B domain-containing protein [Paenibacillus chondroitinus]|uniref:Chondroitinase-B domain-containing protein n=1 Tax=Paenibacillus chondroitinus TaxID=59842 RepID=A0ABU6DGM1_9BACL|nr:MULTISPECIES: chondroitinase-B domain-containing protein [Paenibacillus]MCY9662694.1 discoidin domain-containing protein [Paenibacillus anseongense]MEB4796681.1 chondroitinase-B domain-containing protein [Paenibacillus chondroitinus]
MKMSPKKAAAFLLCVLLFMSLIPSFVAAADTKFSVSGSSVTASSNDGNVPANTVDGDMGTRWSASGDGQWIKFDLGSSVTVAFVKIAFLNGSTRTSSFDIQTSADNATFTTQLSNVTSSLVDGLQTFDFPDVASVRYVRIIGHGNSASAWNSYLEVEVYGNGGSTPVEDSVTVSTSAQLQTAIDQAIPGRIIYLQNGTYSQSGPFTVNGIHGQDGQEIVIKALNRGQAIISGGAYFSLYQSSYVTISGMKFTTTTSASNNAVKMDESSHIRVTRNEFNLNETGATNNWVKIRGVNSDNNRIDRNKFVSKADPGPIIAVDGDGSTYMSRYTIIDRNYFYDSTPRITNGKESIRLGLSGVSLLNGNATVENNLFENSDGDPEIISVKSSGNTVRYNTIRNSQGQVTARHGNNNQYYGNFFLGDGSKAGVGGFRIYGTDHRIYNNYFEGLTTDAINLDGGDWDGGTNSTNYSSGDLSKHWRVYRAQVTNNTIVNSDFGIIIGRSYTSAPVDSRVANNIVNNSAGTLYEEVKTSNTVFEGNIGFGSTVTNRSRTSSEIRNITPSFTTIGGLQKLTSGSAAVNAAVGSYSYVTEDMDGQARSTNDVGADEYFSSSTSIVRVPLSASDVGPDSP